MLNQPTLNLKLHEQKEEKNDVGFLSGFSLVDIYSNKIIGDFNILVGTNLF